MWPMEGPWLMQTGGRVRPRTSFAGRYVLVRSNPLSLLKTSFPEKMGFGGRKHARPSGCGAGRPVSSRLARETLRGRA
jgi:hypothetical protein